ncbi:MAG: hypothetical protein NTY38_27080, partial [Acidobacteria bacterium]|nr:hypothetical protein [Acidobacteriota bacterium]
MVLAIARTIRFAALLLLCALLAPVARLNGAIIVATDPNPFNKVSSGISATLKLIQLTEKLAESKLDNPHVKGVIELLATAGSISSHLST